MWLVLLLYVRPNWKVKLMVYNVGTYSYIYVKVKKFAYMQGMIHIRICYGIVGHGLKHCWNSKQKSKPKYPHTYINGHFQQRDFQQYSRPLKSEYYCLEKYDNTTM